MEAWYTTALDIEEVLAGAVDTHVHIFVADVVKSFDTVDRVILDRVLGSLVLLAWFRHAYFEYHSHVRLRFKLAAGLGQPCTRDGGIPQGCPLSMMFIVALYLPWCRYLGAQCGVPPQIYADPSLGHGQHPRQRGHDDRHEGEVHVVLCFLPPRSAASLHSRDELFAKHIEPEPVDWAMEEASDDEDDAPMPDLIDMPPAPASAPRMSNLERCIALRLVYGSGPR